MKKISIEKILYIFMILLSFLFVIFVFNIGIIPIKYLILIIILISLWLILLYFLLVFKNGKNNSKKIIGYIISLFLVILMITIFYYTSVTLGFFKSFKNNRYMEENYLVLILENSNYKEVYDLNNEKIGYLSNELTNINKAINDLNEKINLENKQYKEYDKLFNDLYNNIINAIIIEQSSYDMISENKGYENLKVLYNVSLELELEDNYTKIDVTNDTFIVFISGIDSYGKITNKARSDVNMLAVINPRTKQILLLSIPRDYYVQLSGTTGLKDKLTHAGIYGIDTSINTIENLLDKKINYYLKVNFSSLEKIVDAIGGVDVYSKYEFISITNHHFSKGYNHLNGNEALIFSRERYNLPGGDITRGENQRAVIDGIIRKVTSAKVITKYVSLLNSLKNSFQTNMEDIDILNFIKMQLNDMASWNITSYGLTGTDSSNYTYSYKDAKLYVMIPNEDSIVEAKELIAKVYNNQILESSFDKEASNIKNPTLIAPKSGEIN